MDNNSNTKSGEYITSKKEMDRRKRAFISLSGSFFVSTCILSLDFIILLPHVLVPILLIIAAILVLLILRVNKTQDAQAGLRICISGNELEWKFKGSSDKCLLKDIRSIRIKRNIKGAIREIRIGIYGMKYLYINGLEDFEEFIDDLLGSTKNVKINDLYAPVKEHLNEYIAEDNLHLNETGIKALGSIVAEKIKETL
jgi:lysophospholipase L1-like esterase